MNKANKSIGWTDYTWNPRCWYCYARKIYKRFKMNPHLRLHIKSLYPAFWDTLIKNFPKKPSKIFVCSTIEIFHPQIKKEWRDWIFKTIILHPQHTFQILTKMPKNIDRPMPDNVWLGLTVTGEPREMDRDKLDVFGDIQARIKFVSYEPILGYVPFETTDKLDWLILGRLTGYGEKFDYIVHLNMDFIKEVIKSFQKEGTKIFIKDNLKEILGEKLIQEFRRA